jgi:pantoate--beta-alanine ligase
MHVFSEITTLQQHLHARRQQGQRIGFVPTMGALHQGHLSLVGQAKAETDCCVCSIFVNPIQFNNAHDLAVYPRTLDADCALLETVHCDIVFAPSAAAMYPKPVALRMDFGDLETVLEGKFRPGHFNGVGIVVSKLFHIVAPDRAYFGQKDLQQCLVIRRLVEDLSFNLELVICPTLRETDGLAMSSRNRNLSAQERAQAPVIYAALEVFRAQLSLRGLETARQAALEHLRQCPDLVLEYFEVVDTQTLQPIEQYQGQEVAVCVAAFLGKTRLIDNILM